MVKIKKWFIKKWSRFIINQLKKGAASNEAVLRVLIHYLLLEMVDKEQETFEVEYTAPEKTEVTLFITAFLSHNKKPDESIRSTNPIQKK